MKKLILIAVVSLFSISSFAQEGLQGTWWAAGQVSFGSEKTGDLKSTSNMILPIVGYFVAPTTTLGLGVGNISNKTESGSLTTAESNTFVVKPLVRKYWNVTGNLYFYGQAALPVMFGKDKITDDKMSSFGLEVSPGFDYIINKWLTVETSFTILNINSTTTTPNVGDKTTEFNFNANPMNSVADRTFGNLQVGVKFLF
jgi:hypothetical protein